MTAVEVFNQGGAVAADEWNRERIELIKRTYCNGAADDEFALFIATCQRTGLSPEARQIFAVQRWTQDKGNVMTTQTSIDGYRLIAQRSREYCGQIPKQWCGADGVWVDVWLKKEHPAAAKAGVYRAGFAEPLVAVATWAEYAQTKKNGEPTQMWATKAALMLAKCAEALALRQAFPAELSGIYTADEMGQADASPPAGAPQRMVHTRAPERADVVNTGELPANVDASTGEVVSQSRKRKPPTVAPDGGAATADEPHPEGGRDPSQRSSTPQQVEYATHLIDELKAAGEEWLERGRAEWKAAGVPPRGASQLSEAEADVAIAALQGVFTAAVAAGAVATAEPEGDPA